MSVSPVLEIRVESQVSPDRLEELGVMQWPIWTKEASTFPWTYAESEVCFLLEREVEVTPDGGEPVSFGKGDLVTFPMGMSCTWEIRADVRKHYNFG